MAKPELGTKRLCPGCGAKYYDLNKDPITCPKCATVFETVMTSRAAKAAKAAEAKAEEEEEDDAAAPEIVTLEEADAEAEGGDDVPDIDGDDDVELDEDSSEDDVFIEEDDEDDDTVPGIRVGRDDDSDQ